MAGVKAPASGHRTDVPSTSTLTATATEPRDHWVWRPEWTPDRTCLYWYLTFPEGEVTRVVDGAVAQAIDSATWLDPVPARWHHVTVADVGFDDELRPSDVERVAAAVTDAVHGEDRLRLDLGPIRNFASAVVLAAEPLDRLRSLRKRTRRATAAALGPRHQDVHRHLFWPHLSLGYVNREVDAGTASRFLRSLPPVSAQVDVGALTLAAVTRRDRHYQWQVQAQIDLLDDAAGGVPRS